MRIVIYSNSGSTGFGGVEILVQRFSEYLEELKIEYLIIENPNSVLVPYLKNNRIISIEDYQPKKTDVIFVPQFSKLQQLGDIPKCSDIRVFSWIVSPYDLILPFKKYSSSLIQLAGHGTSRLAMMCTSQQRYVIPRMYRAAMRMKGLGVMDGACQRSSDYFAFEESSSLVDYLPIPSPLAPSLLKIDAKKNNEKDIHIGYFGRMDKSKFSGLSSFLKTLYKTKSLKDKVYFHIIGNGPAQDRLKALLNKLSIKYKMYGFLDNNLAKEILHRNCTLVVAMGTSALDTAGSGIPTVIIDPCLYMGQSNQKLFRFVHQIEDYTLGEDRSFPMYQEGLFTLEEIVSQLSKFEDISSLGIEYVKSNHNPDKIFSELVGRIKLTEFTISSIKNL